MSSEQQTLSEIVENLKAQLKTDLTEYRIKTMGAKDFQKTISSKAEGGAELEDMVLGLLKKKKTLEQIKGNFPSIKMPQLTAVVDSLIKKKKIKADEIKKGSSSPLY